MTEAEVFASCLALSRCHFLDTPYEGDPFSDELNSGASNVCHYCTIDTLLSIIEKQCLRFTDVRFLNDSTEFLEIIPLIEHVLTNGNYSSSFKQFFLQPSIIGTMQFKGLGAPQQAFCNANGVCIDRHIACRCRRCIYVCPACGCYETSQRASQI